MECMCWSTADSLSFYANYYLPIRSFLSPCLYSANWAVPALHTALYVYNLFWSTVIWTRSVISAASFDFGLLTNSSAASVYIASRTPHALTSEGVAYSVTGSGSPFSEYEVDTPPSVSTPHGSAIDAFGNIIVAHNTPGYPVLTKIAPNGTTSLFAGAPYVCSADLSLSTDPYSDHAAIASSLGGNSESCVRVMAVGPDGTIYFSDTTYCRIYSITPEGIMHRESCQFCGDPGRDP